MVATIRELLAAVSEGPRGGLFVSVPPGGKNTEGGQASGLGWGWDGAGVSWDLGRRQEGPQQPGDPTQGHCLDKVHSS